MDVINPYSPPSSPITSLPKKHCRFVAAAREWHFACLCLLTAFVLFADGRVMLVSVYSMAFSFWVAMLDSSDSSTVPHPLFVLYLLSIVVSAICHGYSIMTMRLPRFGMIISAIFILFMNLTFGIFQLFFLNPLLISLTIYSSASLAIAMSAPRESDVVE